MLNIQSLIRFPIPINNLDLSKLSDEETNNVIYKMYNFTDNEIAYIESLI